MGGYQGGEVASQMAVETVSGYMVTREPLPLDKKNVYKIILDALYKANEDIRLQAESDMNLKGMGTTIVLTICYENHFYVSHVGDSRAYLIRDGEIKQLTEDHSVVAQMVKTGMITLEAARTHNMKNIITQALGTTDSLAPEIGLFEWKKDDYLLLCTDGLTDMLDDQEMRSIVLEYNGEPQNACDKLVEQANKRGGRDNITVVLLYGDI
jgi:protein phosphatase